MSHAIFLVPEQIVKGWTGHVAHMGKIRNSYTLVLKPERRRQLGNTKHGLEDDIKMDLKEIG
jgi:hypothetical protein